MDKSVFGQLLAHPEEITPEGWEDFRHMRDAYPYCAPVQVVALMGDKWGGAPLWEVQSLPRVSLYVMEGDDLRHRLENRLDANKNAKATPNEIVVRNEPPHDNGAGDMDADGYDILKEINSYQEVSFKTAPKSVILSNFLEKDGGIALDAAAFEEVPVAELAKKSIQAAEPLETETMAVMLMRQGKVEQAIAIYEKLISKYPEKSSIFAARIAEIEN